MLAIPFIRGRRTEAPVEEELEHASTLPKESCAVNVDLGLKHLASISVTQGLSPIEVDPWQVSADEWAVCFHDVHIETYEVARYFLDQKQLRGKAKNWFKPPRSYDSTTQPAPPINFKRHLTHLQEQGRRLKSKLDRYRNEHRPNYRQHPKYFQLRREWQRVWRKIQNIHKELARQVATRIVWVAWYHRARTIRFENLSWSQHSRQEVVGYWLATWQVHWFHGEIIRRVEEFCARYGGGIQVDLVYAKETSYRCASCGRVGYRTGKIFRCKHCGKQLDSDLNAARNIAYAPISPSAIRARGRAPVSDLVT